MTCFNFCPCQIDLTCNESLCTETSKVPFGHLRSLDHNTIVDLDDSYPQGETYQACLDNILDTIKLLRGLGFVIQKEKSVLTPSQTTVFLGFIISSKNVMLFFVVYRIWQMKPYLWALNNFVQKFFDLDVENHIYQCKCSI